MVRVTSCDTFVVLSPAATKNRVVFGKNSDRPRKEVQEVQYFPAASGLSGKVKCTYIEIDQAPATAAVVLSKPVWMWGAEMGANEHGLVIGNEAIFSKVNEEGVKEKKLLGMDLLRLGLERSKSAKEAVDVITSLLEKYGQGGPCNEAGDLFYHNSFLICDCQEAYILETVDMFWVVEKITSGFRNISNSLSIGTKFDSSSEGLQEKAKAAGHWDGCGDFNFAKIFDDGEVCDRYVSGKKLLDEKANGEGNFTVSEMISILRNKESDICRDCDDDFPTQGSQVSVLSKNGHSCHWFTGTPDPSISVFKPFIFTDGVLNSKHIVASPDETTGKLSHNLYNYHHKVRHNSELNNLLRELEQKCISEIEQILDSSDTSAEDLRELFKDACETELKFYK